MSYSERALRKQRRKEIAEAKADIASAEERRRQERAANEVIAAVAKERSEFVGYVKEVKRTDPEGAALLIDQGAEIDATIVEMRRARYTAKGMELLDKIHDGFDKALAIMRRWATKPVAFTTKKELERLSREREDNAIARRLAKEARAGEWNILTGGTPRGTGKGSAFEADVEAAIRADEIAEFDD